MAKYIAKEITPITPGLYLLNPKTKLICWWHLRRGHINYWRLLNNVNRTLSKYVCNLTSILSRNVTANLAYSPTTRLLMCESSPNWRRATVSCFAMASCSFVPRFAYLSAAEWGACAVRPFSRLLSPADSQLALLHVGPPLIYEGSLSHRLVEIVGKDLIS